MFFGEINCVTSLLNLTGNLKDIGYAKIISFSFTVEMRDILYLDEKQRYVRVEPLVTIGEVER